MKYFFLLLLVTCACTKISVPKNTPHAIKSLIRKQSKSCLAKVTAYTKENDRIYYFQSKCPDDFHDLYTEKGEFICHHDGGFSGTGDGTCGEYYSFMKEGEVIWEQN